METRHRNFVAPLLGAAAILLTVIVYLMLTHQPKSVDMPRDDATPQTVGAYMAALDMGEGQTHCGHLVVRSSPEYSWRILADGNR